MSKDKEKKSLGNDSPESGSFNPIEAGKSRITKAYKAAMKKSFGTTWTEKMQFWKWPKNIPLFIVNFFKELLAVKEEKEEVTTKAEEEIAQEVLGTGDTPAAAETIAKSMDKEETFEPEEKKAVAILTEDFLEATKATGSPGKVFAKVNKLKKKAEGKDKKDPEALNPQEVRLAFTTGVFTLVRLRQRFNTQEKLEKFLIKVKSASGKSPMFKRFSMYITNHFKKLFQFESDQVPSLLGYEGFDKAKFAPLLISNNKLSDGLDILLPDLFPKAVKRKGLVPLRKFFVRFVKQKRYPDPKAIAELVFMIDDENDMLKLAKRIGGTKITTLATVKETEEKKAKTKEKAAKMAIVKKGGQDKKPKQKAS